MTAVVRFPGRRASAVFLIQEPLGGWLAVAGDFGWLFGSRDEALVEALALARQFGIPVRAAALS